MDFASVNWISVIIVTFLSFPLGTFWHSKIMFGEVWKRDSPFSFDMTKKSKMFRLFALATILHFMAMTALDSFIGVEATLFSGLIVGLEVSIFWIFTSVAATYMFVGRPFRLILIDGGFYVVYFTLAGSILGAW